MQLLDDDVFTISHLLQSHDLLIPLQLFTGIHGDRQQSLSDFEVVLRDSAAAYNTDWD